MAKMLISYFLRYDSESTTKPHHDEIGFDGIMIQIEQQLEKASGMTKKRHSSFLQVFPQRIKSFPKTFEVFRGIDILGNTETTEKLGEGTKLLNDLHKDASAFYDPHHL